MINIIPVGIGLSLHELIEVYRLLDKLNYIVIKVFKIRENVIKYKRVGWKLQCQF